MGLAKRFYALPESKPVDNSTKLESLLFNQRAIMEFEIIGMQPFLYGKYEQHSFEDFDAPPDITLHPFIMAMTHGKVKDAIQDIKDGETTEFEAEVREESFAGYLRSNVKGTISDSNVNFIKRYTDRTSDPIEYTGKSDGKIYRGIWKFGKVSNATFVLSLNADILKWSPD